MSGVLQRGSTHPCLPPLVPTPHPLLPCLVAPLSGRRMFKSECAPYAELAKLCGQDKSPAELSAFAVGKQADFEQACGSAGLLCCTGRHVWSRATAGACTQRVQAPAHLPGSCLLFTHTRALGPLPLPFQDGNMGLVGLAIEGHAKRQIQKLTQTYLTLRWVGGGRWAGVESGRAAWGGTCWLWVACKCLRWTAGASDSGPCLPHMPARR